jgi:hypothetical protein
MARRECTYIIPATLDDALIHLFQFPIIISVLSTPTCLRGVLLIVCTSFIKISLPTFSPSLGF